MKKQFNPLFIFTFFLLTAFKGFSAENEPVKLAWKGTAQVQQINRNPAAIPTFSGAAIDPKARLPYYSLKLDGTTVGSFNLKDAVYSPFTSEEAKFLPKGELKSTPEIKIAHGISNGKPVSIITFAPVRLNPQTGQIEKLTQFEYSYTNEASAKKEKGGSVRNRTHKANSVLSSGAWFKIGITETGIHKIDRTFLQNLGVNMNGLDPRKIQIYGNGGGMLPQANSAPRHDDLVENAIMVIGEQNGAFDADDYILFYGQGPHTWKPNATRTGFNHNLNIYSDTAYYFITVGNTPGRRVTNVSIAASGSAPTIDKFNERVYHERELKNMLGSGREWYGE